MFNEKTWRDGEKIAQEYMKKNGYKILDTNYSCMGVELDIIAIYSVSRQIKALKKDLKERLKYAWEKEAKEKLKATFEKMKSELVPLLVVTEVKSRNSDEFGTGAESVGYLKQKNIVVGAKFYQKNFKYENYGLRFDVASVDFGGVEYIENAFYERHFY